MSGGGAHYREKHEKLTCIRREIHCFFVLLSLLYSSHIQSERELGPSVMKTIVMFKWINTNLSINSHGNYNLNFCNH